MNPIFTRRPIAGLFVISLFVICCYHASAQCTDANLVTSYTSNNGSRGAMFNIVTGANPVTITSFDVNIYGGTTAKYELYYKSGTYIGSETNAAAWTMAGSVNALTSLGNNLATPFPVPLSITIPANSTYGFYFTNTASGGINYITSAVGNVTIATNSDLSIIGGVGKAYPFSSTYSYRLINCTVHYYTGSINESSTLATTTVASAATIQNNAGNTLYSNSCTALISKVTGTGASPVSGSTVAKVWMDAVQQPAYVRRHYQINPATNGTGRVTLYFTDADFNAFNSQTSTPLLLLPVSTDPGTIAARKANLRVERRPGVSSNDSGTPATYSGSPETINPNDADIIWNATASRWEVTFDVSGFSGFWVKTSSFTLPVKLVAFTASVNGQETELKWQTTEEINSREYVVEKSNDGLVFSGIATVASKTGTINSYLFTDASSQTLRYYRLKMVDRDGRFTYSNVLRVSPGREAGLGFSVYSNPVKERLSIAVNDRQLIGKQAILTDATGRLLNTFTVRYTSEVLDVSQYPAGIYILKIGIDAVTVVKE